MENTTKIECKCPHCQSIQNVTKGVTNTCSDCGASITSEDIKNAQAVFVTTADGKKQFAGKNLIKKWWFWVSIVVLIGIIGSIVGGTGSNVVSVGVGEWVTVSDYQMRVVQVENTKEFGSGTLGHFSTQNNYVCVLVELKNNSDYQHTFSYSEFVITNGSKEFKSLGTEAYWYAKSKGNIYPELYLHGTIDGGLSEKYYLVFEIPTSTDEGNYKLQFEYAFDTVEINLS